MRTTQSGRPTAPWCAGRASSPTRSFWTTARAVTLTPADIGPTVNDWLGRSQYSNDPYYKGAIDEFRIYDAALGPLQVAVDAAAGPDNIITNTGAIQSLSLSVNSNMTVGTLQSAT